MPEESKERQSPVKIVPSEVEGISRRRIFDAASLAALGLAATSLTTEGASAAEPKKKVEPLEEFKYDLEKQTHWVGPGGSAKEATAEEFPVSQSLAAVSMRLEAGAIRELHWHALAAEWAYMIEGRCRATVISPNGQADSADFGPGDTWYFPRGHGHVLQGLGPGQCHFLLVFDNGHFSEFGTFSVTDWIANTSPDILTRNLGLPASIFAQFPKKELYIGTGKVPPQAGEAFRNPDLEPTQFAHKYRLDQQPARIFAGGREHVVSQKEFPIQTTLTAVRMDLEPGALREMHWHPHADEWQYYVKGRSRVTIFGSHGRVKTEDFGPGQVAFVKQGYGHFIEQVGDEPTEALILFNSGEYQEISLANWLGANPVSILETNFGISDDMIRRLPLATKGILGRG
ncbi:MAG TPA: cupin domain-containing protein [Bryobacteraceae bacterium]|nr:cupin domain-containing protein [Bryobacteraceae bacterium]